MRKVSIKKPEPVIPPDNYRIRSKFARDVLFPANAVEEAFWGRKGDNYRFITTDGKTCRVRFISAVNNKTGEFDERLDELCKEKLGVPFGVLRSLWIGRLGFVDYFWYWVKLEVEG